MNTVTHLYPGPVSEGYFTNIYRPKNLSLMILFKR